ncbi:hypothetical protein ACOMHN_024416 [Nucella lapillus]
MADGLGDHPSLPSLGPASLGPASLGPASLGPASRGGPEGYLSAGEGDPEFVSDADRLRFLCPVHKGVLRNTRQTPCGHRVCHECVTLWLNGATSKPCPAGEGDCEEVTQTNVTHDRSVQREIRNILVFCKNKSEGCPLKIPFKHYRSHLDDCDFQQVLCKHVSRGCKEAMARCKLKEHEDHCPARPVRCKLCSRQVSHSQLQEHDNNDCEETVTGCPFGCGNKDLKRKEKKVAKIHRPCQQAVGKMDGRCNVIPGPAIMHLVQDHRDVCPLHPVDCKFKHMDCKFVGKREAVEKHEKEELRHHLDLVMTHMAQFHQGSQDTQDRLRVLSEEREQLTESLQSAQRERTSAQTAQIEGRVKDIKMKLVGALEKVITMERKIPDLAERPRVEALEQTLRGLQQQITQLEQRREREQQQQQQQQQQSSLGANTPLARYGTLDAMAESMDARVRGVEGELQMHNTRFAEMDLRFQLLETASYDGTLVWKIRDYAQRKRDAINLRTLSVYSQPFFTHRFGYKMCGRIYLNGDGDGKNTHLSIFFTLMKGEYDALLAWPFKQKVTISVLDQSPQRRHLTESFVPLATTSFQRPAAEMNPASGFPRLVPHATLEDAAGGYLKDDALFIRFVVHPDPNPHFF